MFCGHLYCFQKQPLGGSSDTKPGDHGTPNAYNCWFILFYHVWGSTWIEIHWNSIWLSARSHMASYYTWGSVTTLHDFGGELGRPLDTFFWALTILWSQLLARVWSGPNLKVDGSSMGIFSNHTNYPNKCMLLFRVTQCNEWEWVWVWEREHLFESY
jgi:hypothetical protein